MHGHNHLDLHDGANQPKLARLPEKAVKSGVMAALSFSICAQPPNNSKVILVTTCVWLLRECTIHLSKILNTLPAEHYFPHIIHGTTFTGVRPIFVHCSLVFRIQNKSLEQETQKPDIWQHHREFTAEVNWQRDLGLTATGLCCYGNSSELCK